MGEPHFVALPSHAGGEAHGEEVQGAFQSERKLFAPAVTAFKTALSAAAVVVEEEANLQGLGFFVCVFFFKKEILRTGGGGVCCTP